MNWELTVKIAIWTILGLMLSFPFAMIAFTKRADRLGKEEGKKIVEGLGYEYIRHQPAKSHFGVHFRANGKKYYAKYLYGPLRGSLSWKGKSPQELVEADVKKD
ncbi:hypothetical protein [Pelagicoccus albus]|uniref:Uncharacterized protein n=1 Tax=Pelagicoccus albus TaxID=415222 RepID=A0A7X1E747_9BACT|nr:hypothetical protein [Pelagicoccus albus]MBC2604806.1 hypothetical protein [Pelagicoccus albus]